MSAQDVQVKVKLDTNEILIGDQIKYNIEISQPSGLELSLPVIIDTLIGKVEIISEFEADTLSEANDRLLIHKEFLITSFDTGFYQIPPYRVELKNEFGMKRYYSDYVAFTVSRVNITPPDSNEVIFDIIDPRKARVSAAEVFPWALLIVMTGVILYFVMRWYKNRDKTIPDEKQYMPGEPIHIIALRDLDKLEKKNLWQGGKVKKYYSALTEIIRTYIDRRYRISSLERTSAETLYQINKLGSVDSIPFERLRNILTNADLSKFAKYIPDLKTNEASIEQARSFIRETTKEEKAEPEDALEETGREEDENE
jgi:hypothetical protein